MATFHFLVFSKHSFAASELFTKRANANFKLIKNYSRVCRSWKECLRDNWKWNIKIFLHLFLVRTVIERIFHFRKEYLPKNKRLASILVMNINFYDLASIRNVAESSSYTWSEFRSFLFWTHFRLFAGTREKKFVNWSVFKDTDGSANKWNDFCSFFMFFSKCLHIFHHLGLLRMDKFLRF